ncbi:MAG: TadE/TadG family type IV pilus assembly protein [Bacillota bacterium]
MLRIIQDERGSILPLFAVVVTILVMVAAVAVDFARYAAASEKLQTAGDAAATAAAMSAKRYVRLEIDPGRYRDCCPKKDGGCRPCCRDCGDSFEVEGREDQLLEGKGYKKYCCSCGCGRVKILARWVKYEKNGSDAAAAAEMFFNLNKPGEMDESAGGDSYISLVSIRGNPGDPLYPSVIVRTRGKVKTIMMDFMEKLYPGTDMSTLDASRCSQGGSFYYDLNGKWHRAAREGCN